MKGGTVMCCGTERQFGQQRGGHPDACFCGCDEPWNYRPRFMTREQRIARLEKHLEGLQDEAKAVEAYIAQMKKEN